jgi:hypothetical protein
MERAQRCRAMALLCRQQAVLFPLDAWKYLGEAEHWEHLAEERSALQSRRKTSLMLQPHEGCGALGTTKYQWSRTVI